LIDPQLVVLSGFPSDRAGCRVTAPGGTAPFETVSSSQRSIHQRVESGACAPAASRRYLDRTPPEWSEFAARNAELARSLN
jgi:hypothetical protein